MDIEIKKSKKPIKYEEAIRFMENRLMNIDKDISNELILLIMVGVRTIYFIVDVVTGIFGLVGTFISDKYL